MSHDDPRKRLITCHFYREAQEGGDLVAVSDPSVLAAHVDVSNWTDFTYILVLAILELSNSESYIMPV